MAIKKLLFCFYSLYVMILHVVIFHSLFLGFFFCIIKKFHLLLEFYSSGTILGYPSTWIKILAICSQNFLPQWNLSKLVELKAILFFYVEPCICEFLIKTFDNKSGKKIWKLITLLDCDPSFCIPIKKQNGQKTLNYWSPSCDILKKI